MLPYNMYAYWNIEILGILSHIEEGLTMCILEVDLDGECCAGNCSFCLFICLLTWDLLWFQIQGSPSGGSYISLSFPTGKVELSDRIEDEWDKTVRILYSLLGFSSWKLLLAIVMQHIHYGTQKRTNEY